MSPAPAPRVGKTGLTAALVASLAGPFIAYQEGVVPYTYADPVWGWSVPTACAGETGPHIKRGQTFTIPQCMAMLDKRVQADWEKIEPCIQVKIKPHEAIAIADLGHNAGVMAVCRSTMVRLINMGQPAVIWCQELLRWNKAKGKFNKGLARRRGEALEVCLGKV